MSGDSKIAKLKCNFEENEVRLYIKRFIFLLFSFALCRQYAVESEYPVEEEKVFHWGLCPIDLSNFKRITLCCEIRFCSQLSVIKCKMHLPQICLKSCVFYPKLNWFVRVF